MELYEHQQKAVDELRNGNILWGDVGTGKTLTSIAYFYSKVCGGVYGDLSSMRTPTDLYVITTAKKRDSLDWEGDAALFGIGKDREGSVSGIQMTVDSWNNIGKYEDVKDAFFIFDEQRLVGSGAWTKSFIKIAKSNKWILLSATPGDTWLDYIPVFVANGFYKNRTEFKLRHVVYNTYSKFPKVDRYLEVGRLVRLRNQILVHMPYDRHTVRNSQDVMVDYDEELMEKVVKKRWHVYEERPLRDVAELFSVMRKVVNSDASRLERLRELMQKHPKIIVFYNFDYELEMLRTLGDPPSATSADSGPSAQSPTGVTTRSASQSSSLLEKSSSSSSDPSLTMNGSGSRNSSNGTTTSAAGSRVSLATESDPTEGSTTQTTSRSSGETEWTTSRSTREKRLSLSPSSSRTDTDLSSRTNGSDQTLSQTHRETAASVPDASQELPSFSMAEWNGHKHEGIPKTDRWVYLVQYVAGSEGWNCIQTDAMVFYSQTYSYKNFHQAHGRIDRLNTHFRELFYYHLISNSMIDRAIKRSLRAKKSFNEADLKLDTHF